MPWLHIFNTSHFWTLMVFIEFINSHQLQLQSQWPWFSTVTVYLRCASKASLFRPFFFHALGSQCKHGGTGCYQSHQTGTGWVITSFLLSFFLPVFVSTSPSASQHFPISFSLFLAFFFLLLVCFSCSDFRPESSQIRPFFYPRSFK